MAETARFGAVICLLLAALAGCIRAKDKTPDTGRVEATAPERIFALINQKKNTPAGFPRKFDQFTQHTSVELKTLGLDTVPRDSNTHFFRAEEQFFRHKPAGINAIVFYRHMYGDQVEKILRITSRDSTTEICLAMTGGDGLDSYSLHTEFVNDSLFTETAIYTYTTRDEQEHVAYKTDSVVSEFRYDQSLNLQLLKRDTVRYTEEITYDKNHRIITTSRTDKSAAFTINGLNCFWNFTTTFRHEPGERNRARPEFAEFTMRLTRISDGKVILTDTDFKPTDQIDAIDLRTDGFADLNFDGHDDFYHYSLQNSGSGGAFFNAYIFDPKTREFTHSEELSGGELTADSVNKTLSTYWKMGVGWNSTKVFFFTPAGKIKHTETTTRERMPTDSADVWKTTYVKQIGGKTIEKKTIIGAGNE